MTDRVKRVLLAMQRYNWEQGVTAQAFLESGDMDIAIALALEGANRQNPDGRCCHIGESTAVTDPCAIGEALIFALDGEAVIGYEGKEHPIKAGENFHFAKGGLHSVKANGRFKMALLLTLE